MYMESTIWQPKSIPIKCVAKTMMLHSFDVENYEDTSATMVEKGEIWEEGRKYCAEIARNSLVFM